MPRPTIADVARVAGVSKSTVSRVLNGNTRYIRVETRERVLQAIESLGYRPSMLARGLRNRRTGTVGMLMPIMIYDNFDYYFMKLAHGVRERLQELGYDLILTSFDNSLEDERDRVESFYVRSIEGLILLPTEGDHSYLIGNRKVSFPVVCIDREAEGYPGDCVLADNYRGAFQATKALIEKGHTRIGFITNDLDVTTVLDRIRGYKDALRAANLPFDERLFRRGPYEYHVGQLLAQEILEHNPDVTALFIADNLLTMGALQYVNERGYAIPRDLAVIGFDDFEWERVTTPPLSVVRQPAHEIGKKAAEVLVQRIQEPGLEHRHYWFDTELVVRGSF